MAKVSEKNSTPKTNPRTTGAAENKKGLNAVTGILLSMIIILVLAAAAIGIVASKVGNQDGIYKGVTVSGIDVGGMSRREAEQKLESQISAIAESKNFNVVVGDYSYHLTARDFNMEYDAVGAAAKAFFFGRDESKLENLKNILKASSDGYDIPFTVTFNTDNVEDLALSISEEVGQNGVKSSYEIKEDSILITVGKKAVHVDPAELANAIIDRFNGVTDGDVVITPQSEEDAGIDLNAILKEVQVEPQDAYIDNTDPENPVLVPEVMGITFDIKAAERLLAGEGEGPDKNLYTIALEQLEPEITRESLKSFTYNDLLSTFTTYLNAGNKNRTLNIQLACEKIDGLILYPGDEFSFNDTVGERTYAAGFKDATIYLAGELADGVGGGICQVSSTLYNAAVGADLEITERHNHRYTVTYVKLGMDATVAYDSGTDFCFKNNTDFAIKISIVQESNYVKCDFYGTLTDENRNKTVAMEFVQKGSTGYGTTYKIDDSVPQGTRVKKNAGYTGCSVETYRVTKIDGKEVSRVLENTSKYSKLDEIYLINSADAKHNDNGTISYEPGAQTPGDEETTGDSGDIIQPGEEPPSDPDEPTIPDVPDEPDTPDVPDTPDEPVPGGDTEPGSDVPEWLL